MLPALQFMDGRRLRATHNVEGDGLVRVAAQASDLKVEKPGVSASRLLSFPATQTFGIYSPN
jgi:hypothetical protein